MLLPEQNALPLDPMCRTNKPPVVVTKVGFDCTIPLVGDYDPPSFAACTVVQPLPDPGDVKVMTEDDLVAAMTAFIRAAPRSWQEILAELNGQPYPSVYRAFGKLRHQLGRMADQRPAYPYTFADGCFVDGDAG